MECLNEYCRQRSALFAKINIFTIDKTKTYIKIGDLTLDLFQKIDYDTINEIKKYLNLSAFGSGKNREYDETVRKSLETTNIKLSKDLTWSDLDGYVEPYKLVLYEKDCFFDWHLDTNEEGLIGTLVIELNSNYEGGELILKSFEKEIKPFSFKTNNQLIGCFFPQDIPHKVEKVTNGCKISLIFKVKQSKPKLYLHETKKYTDETLKNLVRNIELTKDDVIWCSDNVIIDYFKENDKFNIHKVISLDSVNVGEFVFPKELYYEILDEKDMYEMEVKDYLYDYQKIQITNIIYNDELVEIDSYRYQFGYRGNSPCSEYRNVNHYDGYVIMHKENPLNDEISNCLGYKQEIDSE